MIWLIVLFIFWVFDLDVTIDLMVDEVQQEREAGLSQQVKFSVIWQKYSVYVAMKLFLTLVIGFFISIPLSFVFKLIESMVKGEIEEE